MYLGIDFLITSEWIPWVIEVNVGLPGGAQEYELTHQACFGKSSGVFETIEHISQKVYGRSFRDYLHSLPFVDSLKPFKIWMDGKGPLPETFHPGLRLEDKWVQYQIIAPIAPVPETMIFNPFCLNEAERFLEKKGPLVLKRRLGRGGRGLLRIDNFKDLSGLKSEPLGYMLQEYIKSYVDGYHFSIRSVAFGGQFICMYANLSTKSISNHGTLAFVTSGEPYGLKEKAFEIDTFYLRSWEATIWFGQDEPPYLRHNLYEDGVARTVLQLPWATLQTIQELSKKIERVYESLDFSKLPKACFED